MAYDAARGQVVLFGGYSGGFLNETWTWNGSSASNWLQLSPSTAPGARSSAVMVYDAAHQQVVMFGGLNNAGSLSDTWVWDGASWTAKSPVAVPPARNSAAMVYDAAHQQVVMFGGYGATTVLNDTWIWDGSNWTVQSPATAPPARFQTGMAFDALHGQVVMFGGYGSSGALNETWVWNGSNWIAQSTPTAPAARSGQSIAYDAALGETVMFGGTAGTGAPLSDTWAWNGSSWTAESPASSPPAGDTFSQAYDTATGQFVIVDGATYTYGQGDFGSVPVGTASAVQSLNFNIPASTTIGSIAVVMEGATEPEFADAGTDSCTTGTYATATVCTVDIFFTPAAPGQRLGAVEFFSGAGNTGTVLASVPVYGNGTGPLITYGTGPVSYINPTVNGLTRSGPYRVAVDAAGNVYTGDTFNNRVVKIPVGGGAATAIAPKVNGTNLNSPYDVAVDGAGNLYIGDQGNNRVVEVPANGSAAIAIQPTVNGQLLRYNWGLAVDGAGDLFISASLDGYIVEVPANGASAFAITATVNGVSLQYPEGIALDSAGDLFIADNENNRVVEVPSSGAAPFALAINSSTVLSSPTDVAVDAAGDVFVADWSNNRVLEIPASGGADVEVAGSFGQPSFYPPLSAGVAVDPSGNLYVAEHNWGQIVEVQFSQPPSLNFPTATSVGSMDTTDGAQTVQINNAGNEPLNFSSGLNGTVDFPISDVVGLSCATATPLTAGSSCDLFIDFYPQTAGSPLQESETLTDNNLNGSPATQSISVSGTAVAPTVSVTVSASPVSIPFVVDGTSYGYSQTFTWTVGSSHSLSVANNAAIGSVDFTFSSWSDGTSSTTDTVTATAGVTSYTASFSATALYLTVSPNNAAWGSVTPASGYYSIGVPQPITATPSAGYYFVNWTGSSDIASATSASTTIRMNAAESITANFALLPLLVVNTTGDTTTGVASNCTPQATATSNTTDTACSLRDALAFAAASTTPSISIGFDATVFATAESILLQNGTLNIPANTTINSATSGSGATLTNVVTVNGNNAFVDFSIAASVSNSSINGLNITGGNNTNSGGGIYNLGTLTMTNSTIINNTSNAEGGGIYSLGTLTMTDSIIAGNTSKTEGGGIYSQGMLTMTDSIVNRNTSNTEGGDISNYGMLMVTDSTIAGGTSSMDGGGIYNEGTLTVTGSNFSGNSSQTLEGGGIYNQGALTVIDSTIYSNTANSSGAGIYSQDKLTVINSTIYDNWTASLSDGGIYNNGGSFDLANTIVSGNSGDASGGYTDNGGNLVGGSPNLGPLANNGGLTETMIPLPGSPAICAGLAANLPLGVTTDQRGMELDPLCPSGYVDSGAVQTDYSKSAQTITFPAISEPVYTGGTVTLAATASSGLAVSYVSVYPAQGICTVTNIGGVWTVNLLAVGGCSIEAQQWGNASYTAAPIVFQNFFVHPAAQRILYPPFYTVGENAGDTFYFGAVATSGLPVNFTTTTPGVCTLTNNAGSWSAALNFGGQCTIIAVQPGGVSSGVTYSAAPSLTQSFTVGRNGQSINFEPIVEPVYVGGSLELNANATSSLPVTFVAVHPTICSVTFFGGAWSANFLAVGTCSIEAEQGGNGVYRGASPTFQNFYVHPTAQAISFLAVPTPLYAGNTVSISASATSGLTVNFASTTPTICTVSETGGAWLANLLIAGRCTITATQSGGASGGTVYSPAPVVPQTFSVSRLAQVITFPAIPEPVTVGSTVTPAATASSGLPVSYISVHPAICTVTNTGGVWTINLLTVGECSIEAQQGGSTLYAGAPFVFGNFYVHTAP